MESERWHCNSLGEQLLVPAVHAADAGPHCKEWWLALVVSDLHC